MNYCLGTVQFGMDYGVQHNGRPSFESVYNILDIAISNNITCFDTSYLYGDAEKIIGNYICDKKLDTNNIKIVSKNASNVDLEIINSKIKESIVSLNVERLYGFLFHDSPAVNDKNLMNNLIKVKLNGLSSKVGISLYTPKEAQEALKYDIDIIQIPYNIFDNRLEKINFFESAKEKGIEIYARSSMLQGLLMMDYNKLPDNVKFAKEYLIKFNNLCKEYQISRLDAAINYVNSNKYIDYIVFGIDNTEQLSSYLSIRGNSIPKDFIKEAKAIFSDVPEKLVNPSLWK